MSTPALTRLHGRVDVLSVPQLAEETLPEGDAWWEAYGGTRDAVSGVITFPPVNLPRCPWLCSLCELEEPA